MGGGDWEREEGAVGPALRMTRGGFRSIRVTCTPRIGAGSRSAPFDIAASCTSLGTSGGPDPLLHCCIDRLPFGVESSKDLFCLEKSRILTTKNAKKRESKAKALSHHRELRGTQRKSFRAGAEKN